KDDVVREKLCQKQETNGAVAFFGADAVVALVRGGHGANAQQHAEDEKKDAPGWGADGQVVAEKKEIRAQDQREQPGGQAQTVNSLAAGDDAQLARDDGKHDHGVTLVSARATAQGLVETAWLD